MKLLTHLLHTNFGYGSKGGGPNHLLEEDIEVGAEAAKIRRSGAAVGELVFPFFNVL